MEITRQFVISKYLRPKLLEVVRPNTYQARAVNRKKAFPNGKIILSVFASSEPSLRLNFSWQLGTEFRLNIRLRPRLRRDRPIRTRSGRRQQASRYRSSSTAIERRSTVQKLITVNPWAIHSNVMTAAPIRSGLQFFADVPWGRRLQIFFVLKLCRDSAASQSSQSNPRSPCHGVTLYVAPVPNADRRCSGTIELGL